MALVDNVQTQSQTVKVRKSSVILNPSDDSGAASVQHRLREVSTNGTGSVSFMWGNNAEQRDGGGRCRQRLNVHTRTRSCFTRYTHTQVVVQSTTATQITLSSLAVPTEPLLPKPRLPVDRYTNILTLSTNNAVLV